VLLILGVAVASLCWRAWVDALLTPTGQGTVLVRELPGAYSLWQTHNTTPPTGGNLSGTRAVSGRKGRQGVAPLPALPHRPETRRGATGNC
jgi:hypothetical protein